MQSFGTRSIHHRTGRQTDRLTLADSQAQRQIDRQTDGQAGRDSESDRPTERQTGKQTDRLSTHATLPTNQARSSTHRQIHWHTSFPHRAAWAALLHQSIIMTEQPLRTEITERGKQEARSVHLCVHTSNLTARVAAHFASLVYVALTSCCCLTALTGNCDQKGMLQVKLQ